jgi:outer membrane protein OmpA-like peptidoglycan-associated protein
MKKIWPWLLLLLLLIIFCVWSKKDSIQLNSTNKMHSVTTPHMTQDSHTIEFVLAQKTKGNTLNGKFTNTQQQNALSKICATTSRPLAIENTSTNKTLVGDEVIELTKKILPHFLAHYSQGTISYNNQLLKVTGVVDSYQSQHEMQRLLNTSTLASQDNSNVLVTKPIEFVITKDTQMMHSTGTLNDKEQINRLSAKLPSYASKSFTQAPHRVDHGVIAIVEKILPDFSSRYSHGKIAYQNEILTVSGMVETDEDLAFMKKLLSAEKMPIVNQTTLDLDAVAKRKAQEEARLAQIAAEKKAQEEAQKKAALNQAETLAKQKAEAEALRLEKAKLAAQAQHTAQAVKEKIIHLLQIENIEFETAKGALTKKGKETVDKLALILKQYPKIKTEIAGHTDSDGSAEFNQKLSQSRVETVKGRLIARGVNPGRLTAKGYGETKPLVPNTTDENKQKNRRVEIIILGE